MQCIVTMKVSLRPIVREALANLIYLVFKEDKELRDVFHKIAPASLVDVSAHTYKTICDNTNSVDDEFYVVSIGDEVIGFTVLLGGEEIQFNSLYSFGIIPAFRTADILKAWLSEVEGILGFPFIVGLYKKNTRAIEFFRKNWFATYSDVGEGEILITTKSLQICH